MASKINRLAIVGLGLMGGSLGLAIKKRRLPIRVVGYARRPEVCAEALRIGACDETHQELARAITGADLVVFCVPVKASIELIRDCLPYYKDGAVITDVGSTKRLVAESAAQAIKGREVSFVGSHPIAGSEQTGVLAADPDLYKDTVIVITPGEDSKSAEAADLLTAFWESVGGLIKRMSAEEHDSILAKTSHLPHIVSAIVTKVVGDEGEPIGWACGSGFRDISRLAAGSASIWRDIIETNRENLLCELRALAEKTTHFTRLLDKKDYEGIESLLARCRELRGSLLAGKPQTMGRTDEATTQHRRI